VSRLTRWHSAPKVEERYSVDQWAMDAGLSGPLGGIQTTWADGGKTEPPASSFDGYVNGAFKRNSVVFAIIGFGQGSKSSSPSGSSLMSNSSEWPRDSQITCFFWRSQIS